MPGCHLSFLPEVVVIIDGNGFMVEIHGGDVIMPLPLLEVVPKAPLLPPFIFSTYMINHSTSYSIKTKKL